MITRTDIFATGYQPASARSVFGSGHGIGVDVHRPWTTLMACTNKRPARHLGEVSM